MIQPRWIDPGSADWPARLTHLESPPQGLWQLGTVGVTTPSVAIVGSRRATFAGVEIAASIARELGSAGIQVISGMALGIDAAAHTGALDAGGSTIAVLGCGIDVCYPPRHTDLRARIIGSRLADQRGAGWNPAVQVQLSETQPHHRGARPGGRGGGGDRTQRRAEHGPLGRRPRP